MARSDSRDVHGFAARILRDNPDFCDGLAPDVVAGLLKQPFPDSVALVVEIIDRRPGLADDKGLVAAVNAALPALTDSDLAEHRATGLRWVAAHLGSLASNGAAVAGLALSRHADVRDPVFDALTAAALTPAQERGILDAVSKGVTAEKAVPDWKVAAARRALTGAFPRALPKLKMAIVRRLLKHSNISLQELAAELLLGRDNKPDDISPKLLADLVKSDSEAVRAAGVRVFCGLGDDHVRGRKEELVGLVTHAKDDVRAAVRPAFERLLSSDAFARDIAATLLGALPTQTGAVAEFLLTLFTGALEPVLASIAAEDPDQLKPHMAGLLNASEAAARAIGIQLLGHMPQADLVAQFDLLLSLATHGLADLRAAVRPVLKKVGDADTAAGGDFAKRFCDRLMARTSDPAFGGGPYNIHFDPPPGTAGKCDLNAYALSRLRQDAPDNDGGLLPMSNPTELIGGNLDDRTSNNTNIGFLFTLAGKKFRNFQADSNGWLKFTGKWSSSTYRNSGAYEKNSAVACFPWWADLRTAHDGWIKTELQGTAPNQVRVIEWRCWTYAFYNANNHATFNFQVCLYEGSNRVEYRYGEESRKGSPADRNGLACGVKMDTSGQVNDNVRDFFGGNGAPPGSASPFRKDLIAVAAQGGVHYPGLDNLGTVSGGQSRGDGAGLDALFEDIGVTLTECFPDVMRGLSKNAIEGFLAHSLGAVQALGARVVLLQRTPGSGVDADFMGRLLASKHAPVRRVGLELLGELTVQHLLGQPDLVKSLATHSAKDIREGVVDRVKQLIAADPAFGLTLAAHLVEHLTSNKGHITECSPMLKAAASAASQEQLLAAQDLLFAACTHSVDKVRSAFRRKATALASKNLAFCFSFSANVLEFIAAQSAGGGKPPADLRKHGDSLVAALEKALAGLPWERLSDPGLLLGLATHAHPSIQGTARPHLLRLAAEKPGVAAELAAELIAQVPHTGDLNDNKRTLVDFIGAMFGAFAEQVLIDHPRLLAALAIHGQGGFRDTGRGAIRRLLARRRDQGQVLTEELIRWLFRKERYTDAHTFVVTVLNEDLSGSLHLTTRPTIIKLVWARSDTAQSFGAGLLARYVRSREISLVSLSKLANHKMIAVRRFAWNGYRESISRIKADILGGLRVLDSDWDDSREFAFAFYRDQFGANTLTAEVLVSIVDSVRPDVQRFGRDLITRHFGPEDGPEYLKKLSQHPAPNVELFVTNYLDRFASGNIERIRELEPYFRRVLLRINKGRAAKDRVIAFLRREALASRQVAALAASVFAWVSAPASIGDRATYIDAMLELAGTWPGLALPINVRPVSARPRA